jgi:hypothetical protein
MFVDLLGAIVVVSIASVGRSLEFWQYIIATTLVLIAIGTYKSLKVLIGIREAIQTRDSQVAPKNS